MNAIILAGGMNTRISKDIGYMPKSLLEINKKPIIRKACEILHKLNINVSICTGFKANMIENALSGIDVTFIHNPFFDVTNNIVSLWFARHQINEDTIILSADIVFQEEVIKRIMKAEYSLTMAVDKSRIFDGDYFFKLSDKGHILEYGADIPEADRNCEYVGISKIKKNASNEFVAKLENMIKNHQQYFENVFFSFDVQTVDISGLNWREIDIYSDYLKAIQQFEVI